jgi:hypothetical protein
MTATILSTTWESLSHYIPFLYLIKHTNEPLLSVSYEIMTRTRVQNRTHTGPRGTIICPGVSPPGPVSTTIRAEYTKHGCTVYGWPSTGGVIARNNCDIVELRFLGWNPLEAPESRNEDQEQEDAFCAQLRMIGGKWWGDRRRFLTVTEEEWEAERSELDEIYIGWPEGGGVLIVDNINDDTPHDIGTLRLVTTMEERCRLLKDKLGAVYYEDPMSYPGFNGLGLEKTEK